MSDAEERPKGGSLPLACTLTSDDGRSRMLRWGRLNDRAAPSASLADGRLEMLYQYGPGVEDELVALADAESRCCSFVTWTVTSLDGQPVLRVTAPAEAPDAVLAVAALFGVPTDPP